MKTYHYDANGNVTGYTVSDGLFGMFCKCTLWLTLLPVALYLLLALGLLALLLLVKAPIVCCGILAAVAMLKLLNRISNRATRITVRLGLIAIIIWLICLLFTPHFTPHVIDNTAAAYAGAIPDPTPASRPEPEVRRAQRVEVRNGIVYPYPPTLPNGEFDLNSGM